jgi:tRNA(Ile2)-agmatinylcytidine synthase
MVEEIEVHSQRKHARIQTSDGIWVSFGEGGPVNQLSRWLNKGDLVEMKGLKSDDGTFHLEQLRVVSWNARNKQRPLCSVCNVRMKSMGRDQGVRCPKCKLRQDDTWDDVPSEPPFLDWVEPPVSSRRHLARPLDFD